VKELSGWGRYPRIEGEERFSDNLASITHDVVLTRGLGRSYGDASLPPAGGHAVANSTRADHILSFDPATGRLRAEAGFSLDQLVRVFLPRGWFVPVSPGTQYVTLGGMVASDVHGKNHHVDGCIGEHVTGLRMRVADGSVLTVDRDTEPELFRATIGGMGLTGHILEVELSLKPVPSPWIWQESERAANLDDLIERLTRSSAQWPYTVCWVDTLTRGDDMGRGIVIKGRWAEPSEAPGKDPAIANRMAVPFTAPDWALAPWSVRVFNEAYYRKHIGDRRSGIVNPQAFFYPLDAVRDWNRIYGPSGFTQYQCVLPTDREPGTVRRFFDTLTQSRSASFLAVIKDCGAEGQGMLSFPKPGISIALDIPVRGSKTQQVVDDLNEIVLACGGRIYLTKDAFTRPEHFRAMEPRLDAWNEVRRTWDPAGRLKSALSVRLLGDSA
jgi:FAD/FMN-containing dehydrogenase